MANVYFGSAQTSASNWNLTASWYSDPGISTSCCCIPGTPLGRLPLSSDTVVIYHGTVTTGPSGYFSSNAIQFNGSFSPGISAGSYTADFICALNCTISGTATFTLNSLGAFTGGTFSGGAIKGGYPVTFSAGSKMTGGTISGNVTTASSRPNSSYTYPTYSYAILSGGVINGNVTMNGGWIQGSILINGVVTINQIAPSVISGPKASTSVSNVITGGTISSLKYTTSNNIVYPNVNQGGALL